MPRSHAPNSNYENHKHIMEKQVDDFNYAFDETFTEAQVSGLADLVEGNHLYFDEVSANEAVCIGEFRFQRHDERHPYVRLSLKKWMRLQRNGGSKQSETYKYRYHLWLESSSRRTSRIRVIRFDNGDSYGYPTPHHMHIQIDSDVRKQREWPKPAHVDVNFPYFSDMIQIGWWLAANEKGPQPLFNSLLNRFKGIRNPARANPTNWVPAMNWDLIEFILP